MTTPKTLSDQATPHDGETQDNNAVPWCGTTTTTTTDDGGTDSSTTVPLVHAADLHILADRALEVWRQDQHTRPLLIGVAGGPGTGKSTIAQLVVDRLRKMTGHDDADDDSSFAIVVPMDGYHFTQQQLQEQADAGTSYQHKSFEELMQAKGAPFTFCPKSFIRDLQALKQNGAHSFPTYSREKSNPVPNGVHVTSHHQIVLVEGLYLLAWDHPDWAPLQHLFDDAWMVQVDESLVKDRLVNRHLENWNDVKERRFGPGRQGAVYKTEHYDLPNFRFVCEYSRQHAKLLIDNNDTEMDDNAPGNADR